jgi:hypothetical protein
MIRSMDMARRPAVNEKTRYEAVARNTKNGDGPIFVGFASRRSMTGLIDLLLNGLDEPNRRIDMLSRATKVTPEAWQTSKRGDEPAVLADGWVVAFTGRTQRDVATLGEPARSIYAREFSV